MSIRHQGIILTGGNNGGTAADGQVVDDDTRPVSGDTVKKALASKANLVGGKVPSWELPVADDTTYGVVRVKTVQNANTTGIWLHSNDKVLAIRPATESWIDSRTTVTPVTPSKLDYAVRSVLPNVTAIPSATTAYSLLDASATTNDHSWQYFHAPASASTYVFPAVTDTTVAHRIKLTIDFTAVQTYSFEDASGTAITPLFTPSITAGDVYEFDCEYSAVKSQWLIWPHKQGSVSDDYVMQAEVGAANGVAGLDENVLVPRAQLPIMGANSTLRGAVWLNAGYKYGLSSMSGEMRIYRALDADIDSRQQSYRPLVPHSLNYAVTAALTDAHKIQLTDAQKLSAQDTLGAAPEGLHGSGAPTTSTVGKLLQQYLDDDTQKTYTCTKITIDDTDPQNPVTSYVWTADVSLDANGTIPPDELPVSKYNALGAVKVKSDTLEGGLKVQNQFLSTAKAPNTTIDNRASATGKDNMPIVPANLEYAARSVLPNVTTIPAATSAYSLLDASATTNNHSMTYEHAPESAPTYSLPAVTDATVKHEIILTVRFSSSVLTYAFEDAAGNPLTPLPLAGTIADGSVVCFRCTWEALLDGWVIMPVMLGTYQEVEP